LPAKNTFKDKLFNLLTRPGLLRPIFTFLRKMFPILVLGKRAIVTRHPDVIEVLNRDSDFTIAEVNEARINASDGPFILGMDRSPQYALWLRHASLLWPRDQRRANSGAGSHALAVA
jgi:hypothetical protein